MMGTDKKQISAKEIPSGLAEDAAIITENISIDKEEKFLQMAAIAFNFRQCGTLPLKKEINLIAALDEEKQYCSIEATGVLKDILREENIPLLKFWLQHCNDNRTVVYPEIVPALLSIAVGQKKLQFLVASCGGKRGEWLAGFNSEWVFSSTQTGEELWHTGTPDQRKEVLRQTRLSDPAKAREWVQQTWAQEDAITKQGFLEILFENISEQDISFLENLSTEKSKKVKEQAQNLLRRIPGSSIIQEYQDIIKRGVSIKKEKALLGLSSKTVLDFQLPGSIPESVFKSGIEKLSGQKNISDESFIFYQLVCYIPPSFWEIHLKCSPSEVIDLFKRTEEGKRMIPAIGNAVGRFRISNWVHLFIDDEKSFYLDFIPLMDKKMRNDYLRKFINNDNTREDAIRIALKEEEEWEPDLAKSILKHAAKNPYQYNKNFFNQNIHLLPIQIVGELEKYTPSEEHLRNYWSNMSEYIMNLVSLKIQTIKAFNE